LKKRIEIIPLALKKIAQRKVPLSWIKETINSPDQIARGYMDRVVRQRKYIVGDKEMLLRVVAEENEDSFIVITAYLTSRMERYRREK